VVSQMLPLMTGQYVYVRTLVFEYGGQEYSLAAKCKFDLFSKRLATGLDFKTLAVKKYADFIKSIDFFDYDRAAAWYMDIAKINYFWIIGISKPTGQVFKFAIERGDEVYLRGRAKYSIWAYRWKMLIEPFEQTLKLAA
jgi:hypothetical protein